MDDFVFLKALSYIGIGYGIGHLSSQYSPDIQVYVALIYGALWLFLYVTEKDSGGYE